MWLLSATGHQMILGLPLLLLDNKGYQSIKLQLVPSLLLLREEQSPLLYTVGC